LRKLLAGAVLLLAAQAAAAADSELVSTYCREIEVPLDETHSASKLGACGPDLNIDLLWHLDRIDQLDGTLDGSYHRRRSGNGTVVYVMDTGVMAAHSEFAGAAGSRVIAGFDVAESVKVGKSQCESANKATEPCYEQLGELPGASHGTSVASLVAGRNIGVAPDASIVSVRVMNEAALATTRTYLAGLNAVIRHAWDPSSPRFQTAVVNISGWVLERLANLPDSSPVPFSAVEKKIRDMVGGVNALGRPDPNGKRFLFVIAGNNVDNGCGRAGIVDRFPAILGPAIDGVITVGGMTEDNSWWPGGCRGGVEILAPAEGIFSATITGVDQYRGPRPNLRSGTSFAAPIIAGIAARLLEEDPAMTPAALESAITNTPSRVFNADASHADGKVAYVRDVVVTAPVLTARRAVPSATEATRLAP
jgi:subtilisin family serine protease